MLNCVKVTLTVTVMVSDKIIMIGSQREMKLDPQALEMEMCVTSQEIQVKM